MSTTTPPGKYRFSSDHRSQAWSGEVSTWMGDRLGILRVVDFLPFDFQHFTVQYIFPIKCYLQIKIFNDKKVRYVFHKKILSQFSELELQWKEILSLKVENMI